MSTECEIKHPCKCYLELKSRGVSLTSICGQKEVPIRLLKKKIDTCLKYILHYVFYQRRHLTSESHSLKLTTAEFLSTSSKSIGTSLCKQFIYVTFSMSARLQSIQTQCCCEHWTTVSTPGAAGCQWQSVLQAWGCSWHHPGRGWTCHWC